MNKIRNAYVSSPDAQKTFSVPNCHSNRKSLIFIIIRAWASLDQWGPYCFSNDNFFVPNDHIFCCLNIPQNSPNLSHLPKKFIIYCHPQFPPLGGAIIKESVFWLITHLLGCTFKNLMSTHSLNCAESCGVSHGHLCLLFFFLKFAKCPKHTFSNSSKAISPICTKLCTQHLWIFLTKSY